MRLLGGARRKYTVVQSRTEGCYRRKGSQTSPRTLADARVKKEDHVYKKK